MRPINFKCKKSIDELVPAKSATIGNSQTTANTYSMPSTKISAKRASYLLQQKEPPKNMDFQAEPMSPETQAKRKKTNDDDATTDVSTANKSITDLSYKTKDLLEKLRSNRGNKKPTQINGAFTCKEIIDETKNKIKVDNKTATLTDSIVNAPHQIEKHYELISNTPELTLPINYKSLLGAITLLDDMICYFKQKHIPTCIDSLASSISTATRKPFNLCCFSQILTIVPEFYTHKWSYVNSEYMLVIDIPSDIAEILENVQKPVCAVSYKFTTYNDDHLSIANAIPPSIKENRIKVAKDRLIFATLYHYNQYILQNNIVPEFDPIEQKIWPSNFNVHSVPPIIPCELKAKPVTESDGITKIIKAKKFEVTVEKSSVDVMSYIREKEKRILEAREEANKRLEDEVSIKRVNKASLLLDSIKLLLKSRKIGTIALSDLIDKLADKSKGHFESKAEIESNIMELGLRKELHIVVIVGVKYIKLA